MSDLDPAVRTAQHAVGSTAEPARRPAPSGVVYVGIVSRAVALVIDITLLNVVLVVVGAATALLMSTFGVPSEAQKIAALIGAGLAVLVLVLYFAVLWSVNATTVGGAFMGFRVQRPDGGRLSFGRAVLRVGLMAACALPLGAGFLPVLISPRRRGLHDLAAHTVVIIGPGDRVHQRRGVPITDP